MTSFPSEDHNILPEKDLHGVSRQLEMGVLKFGPCAEDRKLEYDCPPTPKSRKEGQPAELVLGSYSNFLESTVGCL